MIPKPRRIEELGTRLRLFPLPGALLLPEATLPLNIFEPRYLAMTRDALASDRLIGMIQPLQSETNAGKPALYQIGCAGRIVEHSETADGRILIELQGLCRFDLIEEVDRGTLYRQALVDYSRWRADLSREIGPAAENPATENISVRDALLAALLEYLEQLDIEADWPAISRAPDERLVNALAAICPFGANEKQALLEAANVAERAQLMIALMQMVSRGKRFAPGSHPLH